MAAFKSSKYISILGQPFLKWQVYASVVSVLVVLGGTMVILYCIMLQNRGARVPVSSTEVSSTEVSALKAPVAVSEPKKAPARVLPEAYAALSPLSQLMEKHIRATGLDEVSNYIGVGSFNTIGSDLEDNIGIPKIVMIARAPNLYKFKTQYSMSGAVVEFGFDGDRAWLKDGQSYFSSAPAVRDFFASIAILETSFSHLAWSYRSLAAKEYGLDTVLELLPSEEWGGRMCAVVRSHGLLPITMYHYIDTNTYLEVYRRAAFANGEGVMVTVGIDFLPPNESVPYGLPQGYQILVDGKLHDAVNYTNFRFNRVIMSAIFDAPDESSVANIGVRP